MSDQITDEMVDAAMEALPSVPSLAKFGVGIAEYEGMRRALAAALAAMPIAWGWAWCDTDDNPVAFPWHSGVFRRSCSEWDDCPGPHYPLRKVQP